MPDIACIEATDADGVSDTRSGTLESTRDVAEVVEIPAGRRGRPKGYPRTGGRQKGTPNKLTADLKEQILARGKPVELLCNVARGLRVRTGPQAGPATKWVYPELSERLAAAKILIGKVIPDLKGQEISGAGGSPLIPPPDPARLVTLERLIAAAALAGRKSITNA